MGRVAGIEVGLPRSIDEVDAVWMTAVLRTSGAIGERAAVATMTAEPFAVGAGLLSLLYRARLEYTDGDGPSTVIVKFPIGDPNQRGIADSLGFYPREIRFYREIASRSKVRTPMVHAAMMADDSTDFVVVMEELVSEQPADQRDGATWSQVVASIEAMAALHAAWHESSELDALSDTFLPLSHPVYAQGLPQIFEHGWPATLQHASYLLGPELIAFGNRYGELLGSMIETLAVPRTLIHGDWRLDNLFFDGEGLKVIDFQLCGLGSGAYDLAYFVSQSVAPELRRGREDEMIDRYLAALEAHGVVRDRDEVVHQFKVAIAMCFIYGVSSFPSYDVLPERSQVMMRLFLDRAGQAIMDLDALAVLPG
ncbi:MAG: phosphotransferase [Acidimicrobiales bacterium]